MALYVTHTINHQNMGEKNSRRTDLVFELKKIFEELSIRYNLLPQEVHLSYIGSNLPPPAICEGQA
ncbi:Mechanosensitive ion channel protein 6 [Platanthera guangdongensis]|uniref:Mechanosensitive ion channel protein 6 n=1 Tax=Platanthera guangdongensis TaxID=2320717 RepID=A0ABR2LTL0_9ASPA